MPIEAAFHPPNPIAAYFWALWVASDAFMAHTDTVVRGHSASHPPERPPMKTPLVTMILAALTAPSAAATIQVPEDHPTIPQAVQAASDGDLILVGPGTWPQSVNYRGRDITIRSTDGPEVTFINADPGRACVIIAQGEDAVLEGFTISGGSGMPYLGSVAGGGIYIESSSPLIRNCIITGNSADFGGGMHIATGNPVVEQCVFSNNSSMSNGGGVRIHDDCFPTFTDCTFTGNHTGDFGGAIAYGNDSSGIHQRCVYDGNTADIRGGAIYLGCDCSAANVMLSDFCNSVPDHIVGGWNDLGGNDMCPVCGDDINADGTVGVDDLLQVIQAWGTCACIEDINGDTLVNVDDLLRIIQSWGSCPG